MLTFEQEKWVPVLGYEGYEVSDMGRVRSCFKKNPLIMKHDLRNGYPYLNLRKNREKRTGVSVHRLVLQAFVGTPPDGYNCNHKNGVKTDNRLVNLEWVTPSENQYHALRTGLYESPAGTKHYMYGKHHKKTTILAMSKSHAGRHVGEDNNSSKLKLCEVWLIKTLLSRDITHTFIAKMFKVSRANISLIAEGKRWCHVRI